MPKLMKYCCGALGTLLLLALFLVRPAQMEGATSKPLIEKPIVVVIPSYNNEKWYRKNLDSVLTQDYHNFRVIYLDDASPDGTGALVKAYIKEKKEGHRVTLIHNEKRGGALSNVYKGISLADPSEIVVNLDGDDWFPHDSVLKKVNSVYQDPEVWVTYGQFVYYPCGTPGWASQVEEEVILTGAFRDHAWTTTALRTFYAGLFQKIDKEDLLIDGDFFPMAGDLAYMWPILEMAGVHSRFIPDVLYVYNIETPINDIKKDPELQKNYGLLTRDRPRYAPIDKPY
jgi:glycosyltransferase involved in cell wall biosynthesis